MDNKEFYDGVRKCTPVIRQALSELNAELGSHYQCSECGVGINSGEEVFNRKKTKVYCRVCKKDTPEVGNIYMCSCGSSHFVIYDGRKIKCVGCDKYYELKISANVDHLIEKANEFNERIED